MPSDCIFCKIIAGEIPSTKVYEDEDVLAFNDIQPLAPVHVLLIPKKHVGSANELSADDSALLGRIFAAAQHVARANGVVDSGYRVSTNIGKDAGQAVFHLHFHLLGGKHLGRIG